MDIRLKVVSNSRGVILESVAFAKADEETSGDTAGWTFGRLVAASERCTVVWIGRCEGRDIIKAADERDYKDGED